jgi:pilus assembly protein CpaB
MRNKLFVVLVLAIATGGGLAYATYNVMNTQQVQTVNAPTQPVVVAAADLSLGTELKADDLRVVQWPKGQTPEGSFARPEEIIGRGLIVNVVRNEPVLPAKLASKEAGAGLPPVIPAGMRAVSVRVNDVIGVAGYVLPGTRVDVLATGSPTSTGSETVTKLVLANIQVLTAGTRMEQDAEKGKPMQVTVVTMAVTPEQAERLALASTEGKIQLALRNPLDQGSPETPGIRPAVLLGTATSKGPVRMVTRKSSKPGQAPVMVAEPIPTVEMIRGDKRASEIVR